MAGSISKPWMLLKNKLLQSKPMKLDTQCSISLVWKQTKRLALHRAKSHTGSVCQSLPYGLLSCWASAVFGGATVASGLVKRATLALVVSAAAQATMPGGAPTRAVGSVRVLTVLLGRRSGYGRLGAGTQVVLRPLALGPLRLLGSLTFLLWLLVQGSGTPHSLPQACAPHSLPQA